MTVDPATLQALQAAAHLADTSPAWPVDSWACLRDAGILAWSVPAKYGGMGRTTLDLLAAYEQIAGACLTTAFILSQREGAVRRLAASENVELAQRFLPGLARGELFATIGLSQLTTSRQHLAPPLTATETATGFALDGVIPWVTAGDNADVIIIGAALTNGRQMLLGIPRGQAGVTIEPPLALLAMAGSRTSSLRCDDVRIAREWLVAGPVEKVMAGKQGGAGGLETSCLALGLASAVIDFVSHEAVQRSELTAAGQRLSEVYADLRKRLHALALAVPSADSLVQMRVDCTRLALRATQVAMTTAKGAGFVAPHPVQRWARQALFFLVWSCPRPATEGLIEQLLP